MSDAAAVKPVIARYKPYYMELDAGRTYHWCACGRSKRQPLCDGSHRGTGISPVPYVPAQDGEEVLFCGCKQSGTAPFCDGAHNNLLDRYEEDDAGSAANRRIAAVAADPDGKARLDGSCFVCAVDALRLNRNGVLGWAPVIGAADGALFQSQFYFRCEAGGDSPVVGFGDRHVVLLVTGGAGEIEVGDRRFPVGENTGIYVRPGEAFQLHSRGTAPLAAYAAVCPLAEAPDWPVAMPAFDAAHPDRAIGIDPAQRQAMADRFFQMMIGKPHGSEVVTQFIGEIPLSKAMPHRHLYEESLIILRGRGMMWTETRRAPVAAGDVIFLPRKQLHSLQCTDPAGMLLAGVIYPGDNPSINY